MKKALLSIAAVAAGALASMAADQVPAFPGAEGHGRYTTGGRGGKVVHVTNLNDSGPGSLREAVKGTSRKIVVFDVGGYIDLESDLQIGANTTIAGQTAPAPGITLRYRTVQPHGNNIIIRFIRSRRSQVKDVNDGADAIWCRQYQNMIIDHCSFSWCIDEIASFYDNLNFTMQWTTLGEALNDPGHSKGAHSFGGIWGGKNASFHHNYLTHMQNRSPRFNGARYEWGTWDRSKYANTIDGERVDFRNCVMYNWGTGGCYGGPGGGYINIVNNYYKAGPGTSNKTRVTQVSVASSGNSSGHPNIYGLASRYYINGNYVTAASNPENYDWNGVKYDSGLVNIGGDQYIKDPNKLYGENAGHIDNNGSWVLKLKLDEPSATGEVTTHTAPYAYSKILDYCGASLYRDAVDARYMEECRTGTTTYRGEKSGRDGIVDYINDPEGTQLDTRPSYPEFTPSSRPEGFDTDQDGMPDEWEIAYGLNPNDANDYKTKTLDPQGWYTNLEVYLNSLVEEIMKGGNEDALSAVDEYYPVLTQSGIGDITVEKGEVDRIEYYDLSGRRLAEPAQGISIRRTVYTNGQVYTDKVIKK